jgi:thiol-disulfide isomerase/thioredoxin
MATGSGSLTPAPAPIVGAPAPDFTLPGLDGLPVHLADLRGSVVILNFWATWCGPCREELPLLDRAAADNKNLHVLAVESGESGDSVKTFLTTLPLPSVTVLTSPDSKVAWAYLVRGIPTTFFIDPDGTIQTIKTGALDPDELDSILRQMGGKP